MKILIFGAGAIGSAIGGILKRYGKDIYLLGRKEHIEKIARDGLKIDGIFGSFTVKFEREKLLTEPVGEFDIILLTTKSYSTEEAASEIKRKIKGEPIVVSVQNGIGNIEILSRFFNYVCGCRVIFGVVFENPGEVKITVWGGDILFGEVKGRTKDTLLYLTEMFSSAGLHSKIVDNIEKYIWEKAIYNSALNPLSAILGKKYGELMDNPNTRVILEGVIEEGVSVAKLKKVNIEENYWDFFKNVLLPPTRDHISSMLQDIKKGKKTEIDFLSGAIYKVGMEFGFLAKINFTLWKIIKALEDDKSIKLKNEK